MKFQKPKGTKDILPKDIHKWYYVENVIKEVAGLFNFSEIRTPTFENAELFMKGSGEETDLVGKEMYTFLDKGGNSMALIPEMTPPVVRAYLENGLPAESPIHKLYYIAKIYRYENPQEGRYREHTQFGAEILGSDDTAADVEIIVLAKEVFNRCGIDNFTVKINSIGKPDDRRKYILSLKEYLGKSFDELSEDSKRRYHNNPLRILDSKDEKDIEILNSAPRILNYLSQESKIRFDKVLNTLTNLGVEYDVDFRLVRGIDYYTDTTFEFISRELGSQDAIGGGGRYDGLVETVGGKPTPAVGFASGLERLIMVAERNHYTFPESNALKIYFISLTDDAKEESLKMTLMLRKKGIKCENDLLGRSLKSQMREANKLNAEYVYIIGEEEMKNGKGILKRMSDGTQEEIAFENLFEYIKL